MQFNQVIDWLQGPRAEQVARGIALLLGVWLLYRMAGLVWQIVPTADLPEPAAEAVTVAPMATQSPRLNITEVVNWHLFGTSATPASDTDEPTPIDAPDTRLNLVLRGVLSSDNSKEAHAIIAEPNGAENFYRIGSTLPGDAELKEIYADRIILLRAGRHETLRLPRDDMQGIDAGVAQPSASSAGRPAEILSEYREQMQGNPLALMDLARAVPVPNPAGGLSGFRLFPGKKPALFAQLGLQPGDLVKEANGVVVDNPARGPELMQVLREADQVSLRIERAGKEITLSVVIP